MRRFLVLAITAALTVAVAAVALAADPPGATTGTAKDVAQTQATLTATIDPKGAATTVEFEIGTTTAYGLRSSSKDVPAGTTPVTVEIPVQGLTASTTYHYRVVATSSGGTTQGADATFRTTDAPQRPSVSTSTVRSIVNDGGQLNGSVNPRGQATQAFFEYGTTTSLGSATPPVDAGSGTSTVPVAVTVSGLQPNTRYYYRVAGTNPTGTTHGTRRSFVTAANPSAVTLRADRTRVIHGRAAAVSGVISGPRLGGIRVRLQVTPFPYTTPFADFGPTTTTSPTGSFRLAISPLTTSTQARVVAGSPGVVSPVVTLRSVGRVTIVRVQRTKKRLGVIGRMTPATTGGLVTVQRRTASGRWARLGRARVGIDGSYVVRFNRPRRAILVRAVGQPRDGGAHLDGTSGRVRIR